MTEEEKIKKHYLLEKQLAERIRRSDPKERKKIVSEAYRTVYEEIPWHISRNKGEEESARESEFYLSFLRPILDKESSVLELGCGSGQIINSVGPLVASAWGLDTTLTKAKTGLHPNVRLVESDVATFDLGKERFDLIFSLHLIEHLHPEEILDHLHCVCRHLKPGGKVFIVTPHAYTGPHDISRHFDDYPTGFHLKEYTYRELSDLLKQCGFEKIKTQILLRRIFKLSEILFRMGFVRVGFILWIEKILSFIPSRKWQKKIGGWFKLSNIYIFASKR